MAHHTQQSFLCDCGCLSVTDSKRYKGHNSPRQRYTIDRATGCWNWDQFISAKGYGVKNNATPAGRATLAHRWMYEQKYGPVPDGLELDHLCSNRRCVNPDHLEPVTHTANILRSAVVRIPPYVVQSILRHAAEGVGATAIARSHGVSVSCATDVISGTSRLDVRSSYRVAAANTKPTRGGRWSRVSIKPYPPGEAL